MNITVRSLTIDDYKQVYDVDVMTQKQYLGAKFDQMGEDEKDSHLVSRKSEFQVNVDTGYCFVAEDEKKNIAASKRGKIFIRNFLCVLISCRYIEETANR